MGLARHLTGALQLLRAFEGLDVDRKWPFRRLELALTCLNILNISSIRFWFHSLAWIFLAGSLWSCFSR